MKRLFACIFRWPLVYTKDFNGGNRLRKVSKTPFGDYIVCGKTNTTKGKLNHDGTITASYMEQWIPANKYGKALFVQMKLEN
jgi:hypothetical protein